MPEPIHLDVFVHERRERSVLLSRDGDRRHAEWVAIVHCDLAMRGEVQALATLPRWAAEQAGLIKQRAGADQPGLFEGR